MVWDLGVRDARSAPGAFAGANARWSLDDAALCVSRRGDVIELSLSPPRVALPLRPLVELVQVLDHLVRAPG